MKSNKAALARMQEQVDESIQVKKDFFAHNSEVILQVAEAMGGCINSGGKLLICGNGGSASDSLHFSGEMIGRFFKERRPLPALAIPGDVSALTAIGNDYGYEYTFARSVEAFGKPEDLLFAISTSGKSPNVLKAAEAAKKQGLKIIALTGGNGGPLADMAHYVLNVRLGKNSARIQECHIMIIHLLVDLMDEFYLDAAKPGGV